MSPIKNQMLRTFNASSLGFKDSGGTGGKIRMRSSVPTLALPKNNTAARSPDERNSSTVTPMNKVNKQSLKAKTHYNAWLAQPTNNTTMSDLTESKLQAREREQDELIEPTLAKIEGKLAQTSYKRQEHIRDKQLRLRTSLDIKASRAESWKLFEQEQLEERRRRLETIKKERIKRIKHELDEQTDNFLDYKWKQESKQA